LLKEGKDIPADLQEKIQAGKDKEQQQAEKSDELNTELTSLREKVRKSFTCCML